MAEEELLVLSETSAWEAEHLRLTCFTSAPLGTNQHWWERICGGAPNSTISRLKGSHLVEEGAYGPGVLVVEIQPGRIDILLKPAINEKEALGIPVLGIYAEVLPQFQEMINRWVKLEDIPTISRVAYGTTLNRAVESVQAGYRTLAELLPALKIDIENSSDLMYQINRPRKALVNMPGLHINRLSKWAVARLRLYTSPHETIKTLSLEQYACRLELDINTVPDSALVFTRERLSPVFSELVDLAGEIALSGDRP